MSKFEIFKIKHETYGVVFYGLPTLAKKVNFILKDYYGVPKFGTDEEVLFKLNINDLKTIIEQFGKTSGRLARVASLISKYLQNDSLDQIYSI